MISNKKKKEKYIAQYTYALLLDDAIGKLNF